VQVDKFGIVGKGAFALGVRVKNTHVGRGETLQISLACRNIATCEIEQVQVKLVQEISWTAKTQVGDGIETLIEKDNVYLPGLERDAKDRSKVDELNTEKKQEEISCEIYLDVLSNENKLCFVIPQHTRDSYTTGVNIKVSHYVRVALLTMSTVGNPSTQIPINVGNPSISAKKTSVKLPSDSTAVMPMARSFPDGKVKDFSGRAFNESSGILHLPADLDPSLPLLLDRLSVSMNDVDIIANLMKDIKWAILLGDLDPEEFGTIIAHVNLEFSQARVATFLARHVAEGFTCEHCVAAVQNTTEAFRAMMVEALLPYCVDLAEHHELIRSQLSQFEQLASGITMSTVERDNTPVRADSVEPEDYDVCFGNEDHPGTRELFKIVKDALVEFSNLPYSFPVYKSISKKLKGRRILIHPDESAPMYWREATQGERIYYIGKYFDWVRVTAVTIHSSAGDDLFDKVEEAYDNDDGPSKLDVCLDSQDHPGNAAVIHAVRNFLKEFPDTEWSPPIDTAITSRIKGRRFFVHGEDGEWQEATQTQRINRFKQLYEKEKSEYNELESNKTQDHQACMDQACGKSLDPPPGGKNISTQKSMKHPQ
jgi:hypothetical protein